MKIDLKNHSHVHLLFSKENAQEAVDIWTRYLNIDRSYMSTETISAIEQIIEVNKNLIKDIDECLEIYKD